MPAIKQKPDKTKVKVSTKDSSEEIQKRANAKHKTMQDRFNEGYDQMKKGKLIPGSANVASGIYMKYQHRAMEDSARKAEKKEIKARQRAGIKHKKDA